GEGRRRRADARARRRRGPRGGRAHRPGPGSARREGRARPHARADPRRHRARHGGGPPPHARRRVPHPDRSLPEGGRMTHTATPTAASPTPPALPYRPTPGLFWRESFIVFRRQLRMNLRNPAWVIIGLMQPVLYLL